MNAKQKTILQVNSYDHVGGVAKLALKLRENYEQHDYISYLAVGFKTKNHPNIFEIPKNNPVTSWQKFWYSLENKTKPLLGKIKGTGKLKNMFHAIAWPKNFIASVRGLENFNFSGTQTILDLCPTRPDILHLHNLHANYFDLRMLPWLSHQVPTIITPHDSWLMGGHCAHSLDCTKWKHKCGQCPYLMLYPTLKRDTTKQNLKRKSEIYAQSRLYLGAPSKWILDKAKESVLSKGIVESKLIYNGVDLTLFKPVPKEPLRKKLHIPTDAFVLLFVAQAVTKNTWKDYKTLEAAIMELCTKQIGQKILLLCVGTQGPQEKTNSPHIKLIPYLSNENDLIEYYQLADLYVHPVKKEAETSPMAILEAIACGIPIIASNVGGIVEEVIDLQATDPSKATGILVEKQNQPELVQAIKFMIQNKKLRQQIAKNARLDACDRFNLQTHVKNYLSWYEEILKRESHEKTGRLNRSRHLQSM